MRSRTIAALAVGIALLLVGAFRCPRAAAQFADAGPPKAEQEAPAAEKPAGEQEQPAQEEPPEQVAVPASFDFEAQELQPCWFNIAHEGKMRITHEPADVREGQGALEFAYTPSEGNLALIGATPVKPEGAVRSLSFSLKTEQLSPILFGLNEADGSSYQGYCYTPGGAWHDVLVDVGELMLSEDTTDENEHLDVDQINTIIVADLCNLAGEAGRALGIKRGVQRMWLDNVGVSEKPAPHRSSRQANGSVIIDDFDRDLITCLPIGAPKMTLVSGPQTGGDTQALEVAYRLGGHRWVGFVAAAGYLDLCNASALCLTLKAAHQARLTVVLEERDGSKYATRVDLRPAEGWHQVVIPVAQLTLDPQTDDENAQLDLGQLRVIIPVVDTFNASVGADGLGSYTISRIWVQ